MAGEAKNKDKGQVSVSFGFFGSENAINPSDPDIEEIKVSVSFGFFIVLFLFGILLGMFQIYCFSVFWILL